METASLWPGHEITRVIRGGWQLAPGHTTAGNGASGDAVADLLATAEAGINTFDCADIYTGVEETIGAFRKVYRDKHGAAALGAIKVHTKFVPDLAALGSLSRTTVRAAIDQSRRRLGMDRLDLVQFHWWDEAVAGWRDAAGWLGGLAADGAVAGVGGTNFGARHVRQMLADGVPLKSMQVQYSVLDDRPAREMAALGVPLLCYGTVAGGFLSDRWLGAPEPAEMENRSLVKYKLIIDDVGGWDVFQSLLAALRSVADRHRSDIATVASRWVLGRDGVAAVIVGARNRSHLSRNLALAGLTLSPEDVAQIDRARASLKSLEGDVYDLERDRSSPHGAIMKYNLNKDAA
ncbi:MAG: aldo/keto reductase [Pseudomonadota bacterium]